MKENEKGNYECTMTFILVKIERLNELNKILFVSYSNTLKKIFEFDIQNIDEEKNKCQEKDMQEINGIFMAVFNYEDHPQENEENQNDENNNNNNTINNSINSENNGRLSYGGKKRSDNVLLELKKILVNIYKDNYDDLREALKDYDDLIKTKVSMNL